MAISANGSFSSSSSLQSLPVKSPIEIDNFFNYSARLLGVDTVVNFKQYENKVILVVNIGLDDSKTIRELTQLNDLAWKYGRDGQLAILAFPCAQFGQVRAGRACKGAGSARCTGKLVYFATIILWIYL